MQKLVFSLPCSLLFHCVSKQAQRFSWLKRLFALLQHAVYWKRSRFMVGAQSSGWKSTRWRFCDVHNLTNCSALYVSAVFFLCCTREPYHPRFVPAESQGGIRQRIKYIYLACAIFLFAPAFILRHSESQTMDDNLARFYFAHVNWNSSPCVNSTGTLYAWKLQSEH